LSSQEGGKIRGERGQDLQNLYASLHAKVSEDGRILIALASNALARLDARHKSIISFQSALQYNTQRQEINKFASPWFLHCLARSSRKYRELFLPHPKGNAIVFIVFAKAWTRIEEINL
jgi:hypothetical protein